MDKKEIKEVIEWCDEKGHTEHEILELIRRIVDAKPRIEKTENGQRFFSFWDVYGCCRDAH